MIALEPRTTAVVAIDMHRGHLDPGVATLPLAAERCGAVIARAADLFGGVRALGVPVVHVVTEYRDSAEIAANPFWKAAHDDPGKARADTVILAGINTTSCVLNAAFDSTNRDFRVVIAADAVDSMDGEQMHGFALRLMAATCGWPLSNQEILKALRA
jgi:biuret amidohydrolase